MAQSLGHIQSGDGRRARTRRSWWKSAVTSMMRTRARIICLQYAHAENGPGIYEVDMSKRKCIPLLLDVGTAGAIFARDGKSFFYAVSSGRQVWIYRQLWKDGKLIGTPQVALELPFTFPLGYGYGALSYDFSRDLSTIVFSRTGGHAELYLLAQN
jgi:hypothetical protein